ncbi:MAG: hypothetical protein NVS2B6_11990 [Thermoleophilaceae bacterium]
MNVLAISSYGVAGGAELALATFLAHRPPGVSAAAILVTDGPLRALLSESGIPIWIAGDQAGRPTPRRAARFTRSLLGVLRRFDPDVVWAVGQKAALLSVPSCRARGVPLVWHKVDFSWDRPLARPLAAASSGVIAVSRTAAEPLGRIGRSRLVGVVWPPVRLPDQLQAQPGPSEATIGTLARLVPYKGLHHIIRAGGRLATEFPNLRVILAGAPVAEYPDYPARLRAIADEVGLGARVELTGHVADVSSVLSRLNVFVSATYRDDRGFGLEGLGAGIIEASYFGLPVVVARAGGSVETLQDGRTGTLVDAPDPDLLAGAIAPYLRDPAHATATGAAGREFARAGAVEPNAAARKLFDLLAEAAASPSRR